jgi:hypothetical protein
MNLRPHDPEQCASGPTICRSAQCLDQRGDCPNLEVGISCTCSQQQHEQRKHTWAKRLIESEIDLVRSVRSISHVAAADCCTFAVLLERKRPSQYERA